ncbi:S-locus-specific glycoprotein S6-like [Cryptomeria japonica]|uniref:S-locus-specific glycoprotein S6-like n=1 Tax=Cryptomeria japonica TaxID=3369 RepID=UPI0027DA778F|nr:S-locus-specific glycoprotein S6-like [Cryptomeria japonica]
MDLLKRVNAKGKEWAHSHLSSQSLVCAVYCTRNNDQFCSCLTGFTPRDEIAWAAQAWSGGCKRRISVECGETSTDGFVEFTGNSLPADAVAVAKSASEEDCRSDCLSDCSCTAYAYNGTLCNHWLGELLNLTNSPSSSTSLFVRLSASDVPRAPHTKNQYIVLITINIEDI